MIALAEVLGVRAVDLAEGGNPALIADLREAAGRAEETLEPAEEFAARFPAWAAATATLHRQLRDQETVITALSDRLTHDPFLAEAVHGILSNVTAIRSTAAILSQMADLPRGQVDRFHEGLHTESVRLSGTAQDLAEYLSRAGSEAAGAATAEEALDQFLAAQDYHFADLDAAGETDADPQPLIADRLAGAALPGSASGALLQAYLHDYAQDARAMPLSIFAKAAEDVACDPVALAATFRQPLLPVFRRLSVLRRPGLRAPAFGLIVVTASGYPLRRRPLPDFALPRHGNACPIWPLFRAFTQAGQPVLATLEHDGGERFVAIAAAEPRNPPKLGAAADLVSGMLIVRREDCPLPPPQTPPEPVGTSCRICTRDTCKARTLPRFVGA